MKGFIRLIAEYVGQCSHDAPRVISFYVVPIPVQHGPAGDEGDTSGIIRMNMSV